MAAVLTGFTPRAAKHHSRLPTSPDSRTCKDKITLMALTRPPIFKFTNTAALTISHRVMAPWSKDTEDNHNPLINSHTTKKAPSETAMFSNGADFRPREYNNRNFFTLSLKLHWNYFSKVYIPMKHFLNSLRTFFLIPRSMHYFFFFSNLFTEFTEKYLTIYFKIIKIF